MQFPTTQWTALAQASLNGDTGARASLENMCRAYYPPVMGFLRSRGHSEADAQDFTQEFFSQLLRSSAWKRADRLRGKFRTFLLGVLMHVLHRARTRAATEKRGSGMAALPLDDFAESESVPAEPDDVTVFDREWALGLMNAALDATGNAFSADSGTQPWETLAKFLPGAGEPPSYEAAAQRLGLSVPALKSHVHRVRQRFRDELRRAVAMTVGALHEVDDELTYLHRVLTGKNS